MVDKTDILKSLKKLGLDETESNVYKTLLLEGKLSVLNLSKKLSLPRTTVYRLCENLVEKGFLEWVVEHQGRKIKATPPRNLTEVIAQKQEELVSMKLAISNLSKIENLLPSKLKQTEVRYYYGKAGMRQLIWNTLDAKNGIIGYSIWGRNIIIGEEFERKYMHEMRRRKISDKVILDLASINRIKQRIDIEKGPGPYQNVRVSNNLKTYGDTYIYNDIYAVNMWESGEVVGIEIENEYIANLQKSIFKNLWGNSESLNKYLK